MWVGGASLLSCADAVDTTTRLLPNALRISGWSHGWGNLMSDVARVCPKWPTILDQLRTLVSFWRNATWRRWVKRALVGTDIDESMFEHCNANLANWRYQTIPQTMEALLPFRKVCEEHLTVEMFGNVQD